MTREPARDVVGLSRHVLYEAEMTQTLVLRIGEMLIVGEYPQWLMNAAVESFGIHVRAQLEFLYADSRKFDDDGIALDLVRNGEEWRATRGKRPRLLVEVAQRANKEIAHITFHRVALDEQARQWHVGNVHEALARVLKLFIPQVPEDRVERGWTRAMWKSLPGFVRGRDEFYRPHSVPTTMLPPGGTGPTRATGSSSG
jgi:hypothetical protein